MLCSECGQQINPSIVYCPYCGSHVEGTVECEDYTYEAFISYRHLPKDRATAMLIQGGIEGTSIPSSLHEKAGKRRFGKLFRDEDELSAAASLSNTIANALEHSRYLIVVCSPQTRESAWVMLEVETFASLHGRDRILVALVDGEPRESFPPMLLSRFVYDSEKGEYESVPSEPLAANFNPSNKANFKNEITRLKAAMIGCDYDDLQQRLRSRRLRRIAVVGGIVTVLSLVIAVAAITQGFLVRASLVAAIKGKTRLVTQNAQEILADGDRIEALETLYSTGLEFQGEIEDPVPEAQMVLEQALGLVPQATIWENLYSISGADRLYDSRGELQAVEGIGETVLVSNVATGVTLLDYDARQLLGGVSVVRSGLTGMKLGNDTLLCRFGAELVCISPLTGKRLWQARLPKGSAALSLSMESNILYLEESHEFAILSAAIDADEAPRSATHYVCKLHLYEESTGRLRQEVALPAMPVADKAVLSASDDGSTFAVGVGNEVAFFDRNAVRDAADAIHTLVAARDEVWDVDFVQDRLIVTSLPLSDESSEASIECYDTHGQGLWAVSGSLSNAYAYDGATTSAKAELFDVVTEDSRTLVLAIMGSSLNAYDMRDGSIVYSKRRPAPILVAGVLHYNDKWMVAGCTSTSSLFVTDLRADNESRERDAQLTMSLPYGIADAHVMRGEGGLTGIAVWARKTFSYKIYSPKTLVNPEALERKPLPSYSNQWVLRQALVSILGDWIEGFDFDTFDSRWRVSSSSLGMESDKGLILYDMGSSVLVSGYTTDAAEGLKLTELSLDDGAILSERTIGEDILQFSLDDMRFTDTYVNQDGRRVMLVASNLKGVIVDLDTQEVISRFEAEQEATLRNVWMCNDSIITYQTIGAHGKFMAYGMGSGKELFGDLTRQSAYEAYENLVVDLSEDMTTIAVVCADGLLRAYSTTDCSLIWEAPSSVRQARFVAFVNPTAILVQNLLGKCTLVDAASGQTSQTSDIGLPPFSSCSYTTADGKYVIAACENEEEGVGRGLVVVSLGQDCFGPMSYIRYGIAVSKDGKKALCCLPWLDECVVYPRYGFSELVGFGVEELAVHGCKY